MSQFDAGDVVAHFRVDTSQAQTDMRKAEGVVTRSTGRMRARFLSMGESMEKATEGQRKFAGAVSSSVGVLTSLLGAGFKRITSDIVGQINDLNAELAKIQGDLAAQRLRAIDQESRARQEALQAQQGEEIALIGETLRRRVEAEDAAARERARAQEEALNEIARRTSEENAKIRQEIRDRHEEELRLQEERHEERLRQIRREQEAAQDAAIAGVLRIGVGRSGIGSLLDAAGAQTLPGLSMRTKGS